MIDKSTIKALLIEMHKTIDETSNTVLRNITEPELTYPPGLELTISEKNTLKNINLTDDEKVALKKIITDACSFPLFHLFSLLDGVTDPKGIGDWRGLTMGDKNELDDEMLHDEFYESYHEY